MNVLASTLRTLTRKSFASVIFKVFLVAYILKTLASAIMRHREPLNYADMASTGNPVADWLMLTVIGIKLVSALGACFLILQVLLDLEGENFWREANVRRFRGLTILTSVEFLTAAYIHSSYFNMVIEAMEPIMFMSCLHYVLYMLLLVLMWFGFSLLLRESIRIQEENQQIV